MAVFFFLAGLEITRETLAGELASLRLVTGVSGRLWLRRANEEVRGSP